MKVLVLTTSYPPEGGTFVAASVEAARSRGLEVDVVGPHDFRHFGICGGHGIVGNLRARPWLALLVPAMLWNMRRAAVHVECDLVHAHWLVCGAVAATLGKPYVVQPWGTDVALLGRLPWRFPHVIAASPFLAEAMGGAAVVPTPLRIPEAVSDGGDTVLFVGRLSPEKGIEEFLAATAGLSRTIVGSGPIIVPESVGALPPEEIGAYYDRAAIVVVPSRREGYGMVAREAMAHGRAVVATRVGGLEDAIEDGVDGLLVPAGDVAALRTAVERLLDDPALRARIGVAARAKAERLWSPEAGADALLAAYEQSRIPASRK